MSKMKELYTENTTIQFDTAECAECSVEIMFASQQEFTELVNAHVCIRLV